MVPIFFPFFSKNLDPFFSPPSFHREAASFLWVQPPNSGPIQEFVVPSIDFTSPSFSLPSNMRAGFTNSLPTVNLYALEALLDRSVQRVPHPHRSGSFYPTLPRSNPLLRSS